MKAVVFLIVATFAVAFATRATHCGTGEPYEDPNEVQVTDCDAPPCVLKSRTRVFINQKFVPQKDCPDVITNVKANVLGIPLPFIGVDGVNACDKIQNADGTKAECPLVKGKEYHYSNSFPILPLYPKISLTVHWSLTSGGEEIACFEVPARISN